MAHHSFPDYRISTVTPADLASVRALEHTGQIVPWTDAALESELAGEHAFHFGIYSVRGHLLRAFILSRIILDELHIHHLCTHPAWRRRGLAQALLEHSIETAVNSARIQCVFLEVAASNTAAVALYGKRGFSKEFIRKKYYSTGDDAIVMSKKI